MIRIQNFRNVAASCMQNRAMDRIRECLQRGNAELKLRESGGGTLQARSQKMAVPAIERERTVSQLKAQDEAHKKLAHGMALQRLTAQSSVNGNSNLAHSAPLRCMSGNSNQAHKVDVALRQEVEKIKKEKVVAVDGANVACALGQQPKLTEDICIDLQSDLQDENELVRMQAVITLETALRDPDEEVKVTAAIVLGPALRDANEQVRIRADIALEAALQDTNEQVRIQAALALGSHRDLSEMEICILFDALENQSDKVSPDDRINAVLVLGAQSELTQDICVVLEAALEDYNKKVKFYAEMVLEEALQNADEQERIRVALALGRHRTLSKEGMRILLAALKNQSEKVSAADRVNATEILGEQLELFKILEGDEKEERIKAAMALEEAARQDADEQVRIKAATALARYADILS